MSKKKIKELARNLAEARIWLERGDIDGATACLDGCAGLIPDALYPNHNDVEREMDEDI